MDAEMWVVLWRMLLTSMSAFLVGSALVISFTYLRAWKRRGAKTWRGLLPLHVFAVTLSYSFLLAYATAEIIIRIGDHANSPTWRGLLLAPAYLLGFFAMYSIAKFRKTKNLVESKHLE